MLRLWRFLCINDMSACLCERSAHTCTHGCRGTCWYPPLMEEGHRFPVVCPGEGPAAGPKDSWADCVRGERSGCYQQTPLEDSVGVYSGAVGSGASWRTSVGVYSGLQGAVTWARLWVPAPSTVPSIQEQTSLAPSGQRAARQSQVGSRGSALSAAHALVTETQTQSPSPRHREAHTQRKETLHRHVVQGTGVSVS